MWICFIVNFMYYRLNQNWILTSERLLSSSSSIALGWSYEVGNLVGKFVELFFTKSMIGTSVVFGCFFESLDLSISWMKILLFQESFNCNCELFFTDLTVIVGVNLSEYTVRFFPWDACTCWFSEFDGRDGGDESEGEGEFHFEMFVVFIL